MNFNERMKDIEKLKKEPNYGLLWCRHGNWLIEQAEIVQQQTKYIRRLENMVEEKDQRIFEMQANHMTNREIR